MSACPHFGFFIMKTIKKDVSAAGHKNKKNHQEELLPGVVAKPGDEALLFGERPPSVRSAPVRSPAGTPPPVLPVQPGSPEKEKTPSERRRYADKIRKRNKRLADKEAAAKKRVAAGKLLQTTRENPALPKLKPGTAMACCPNCGHVFAMAAI